MLSLVDLMAADTIPLDLAAYLAGKVYAGASFLVGASPGGAGKTTVMGALLACVPPGCRLIPADNIEELVTPPAHDMKNPLCYVCHEIGAGFYYAYLWDRGARAFFALPQKGHQIATNLHADTYEECRAQLCDENGVAAPNFNAVNYLIFLRVGRGLRAAKRTIETVWESDGKGPHHLMYQANGKDTSYSHDDPQGQKSKEILQKLAANKINRIEEFRLAWLEEWANS